MLLTGVVEIVVQGTVATAGSGTKNIFNVFHYSLGSLPLVDSLSILGSQFNSTIWNHIAPSLSITYTGVQTLIRLLDDATSQYVSAGAPGNGAVTGARLPTYVSVAYLFRTELRGKNFRGGKRFSSIAESDVLNDELTPASLTAHWNDTTAFLSTNLSGGPLAGVYRPVVVSRTLSQLAVNPTTIQGAFVTAALLNRTVGTMRRRKEKTVR